MIDRSENDKPGETPDGERIAKVMARAGLCSRRDAERWITDGRVSVNGRVLDSPAFNVTEQDQITVDNRPIAERERTRLFMFHKPRGTVTTDHDPEGRNTIFDVLPEGLPRLVTIGRLDINTEGLLLLTNDGGLARVLELPSTGWLRRYRVRAHGDVNQAQLDALASGVVIEGIEYRGIEAKVDRVQGANVWLTMGLREGKNREIKRVLEHLGLSVNRLIRVSYGPFQLGELEEGAVDEVKTRILKDQLGEVLAAEAGVDFEAPVLDTKDREKIARRHPNEERPAPRERSERSERSERPQRGGERPQRGPARSAPRDEPEQRPKSARDLIPRNRKHVSLMRSEKAEAGAGEGRRKIERSETADRRGRTVPVERVTKSAGDEGRSGGRNARRFAQERDGGERPDQRGGERSMRRPTYNDRAAPGPAAEGRGNWRKNEAGGPRPDSRGPRPESRGPRPEGGGRPWAPRNDTMDARERPEGGRRFERTERPGAGDRPPRRDFGDRAPRKDFGDRPPRKDFGDRAPRKDFGARPPRPEGGERPARRDFGDRPPRKDFGDRPPRPEGGERPARRDFGDRPPRKDFGDRPPRKDFGDRPPRKEFGDRPPRAEAGERPARRDFGDRPPRKDFGDRPPRKDFGDRPPRKDSSDRPPRGEGRPGKSFGAKSFGSKPGGGKGPGGGRPSGGAGRTAGSGRPGGAGRSGGSGRPFGGKPGGHSGGKPGGRPGGSRSPR